AATDAAMVDAATTLDAALACPSPIASDPLVADRLSCRFGAGALPAATVGLDETARRTLPLRHVVVIMKENGSFDHLFGGLGAVQPAAEIFPAGFSNRDLAGNVVAPFHLSTTCVGNDPDHQWDAMHAQIDNGRMDGYVTSAARSTGSDGHFA